MNFIRARTLDHSGVLVRAWLWTHRPAPPHSYQIAKRGQSVKECGTWRVTCINGGYTLKSCWALSTHKTVFVKRYLTGRRAYLCAWSQGGVCIIFVFFRLATRRGTSNDASGLNGPCITAVRTSHAHIGYCVGQLLQLNYQCSHHANCIWRDAPVHLKVYLTVPWTVLFHSNAR